MAIENMLEDLKKNETFSSSHLLNGIFSLQSKLLNEERVNLFVAFKLFVNEVTICEEIRQYVSANVKYECNEDDTDDDDDGQDDNNEALTKMKMMTTDKTIMMKPLTISGYSYIHCRYRGF